MIEAISSNEVFLPSLTLAPDTMFSYHGNIECDENIIHIPGLPSNNYIRITVFGGQHDVHTIYGERIQLRTALKKSNGYFNSGYACNDGRHKANWYVDGLTIQDVVPGRIRFRDKFTVGRLYKLYTINPILLDNGTFLNPGTTFDILCKVNFAQTTLEGAIAEAGCITLTFSDSLSQEGSISGIDYDYLEYDENKLHIYTTESGTFTIQVADFFDIYENSIEDAVTDVIVPANSETSIEYDGVYGTKYRSRYDYEDIVLARGYKWLQENGIK